MPVAEYNDPLPGEGYNPGRWYQSIDSTKDGIVLGRFVERQVVDKPASKAAGEYIYKKVVGCYMKPAPSDDTSYTELTHYTSNELISRFPDAWKSFIDDREDTVGTTLKGVPWLDRKAINKLFGLGVYNMEQLAALPEKAAAKVFGVPPLRRQAESYLKASRARESVAVKKGKASDAANDMHGRA